MMRVANRNVRWPRQMMQRVDKIAGDLNVVLLIFAVGLATLDFTFLVTQKVVERLPEVTRMVPDQSSNAPVPLPSQK